MCNPLKALDRAIGTNTSGYNPGPAPAPKPTPAPAPAPTPAPAPMPGAPSAPAIDYNSLAKGYSDFARPQIDQQYRNATDALTTGLAEKGLSGSNISKSYTDQLDNAYSSKLSGLAGDANTYAHGNTGSGYTPLGDLFSNIVSPVASFNANNRFVAPPGMAVPSAGAVGTGSSVGTGTVSLAPGNSSRVVA